MSLARSTVENQAHWGEGWKVRVLSTSSPLVHAKKKKKNKCETSGVEEESSLSLVLYKFSGLGLWCGKNWAPHVEGTLERVREEAVLVSTLHWNTDSQLYTNNMSIGTEDGTEWNQFWGFFLALKKQNVQSLPCSETLSWWLMLLLFFLCISNTDGMQLKSERTTSQQFSNGGSGDHWDL